LTFGRDEEIFWKNGNEVITVAVATVTRFFFSRVKAGDTKFGGPEATVTRKGMGHVSGP
jgi:hypothetical protein